MEKIPTGGPVPVTPITAGGGIGRRRRLREATVVRRPPRLRPINLPRRFKGSRISPGVDLDIPFELSDSQSSRYVTRFSIDDMDHDYVTAKCRLLLNPGCDLPGVFRDVDTSVPWSDVLEVRCFQTETAACPICLFPPVAPRMGPCGHIYCYPCVWHFINYENDFTSRQCAVCNTYLRVNELIRVRIFPAQIPRPDDIVEFSLMKRYRSVAFPVKFYSGPGDKTCLPTDDLASSFLSRVAVASRQDWVKLIRQDIVAMDTYLADCKSDGFSDCMIPVAESILQFLESELSVAESTACQIPKNMRNVELTDFELERPHIYYKAVNGQDIYLHSVNWRCLQLEYDTENLPPLISGRVIEVESYMLTEDLRRRYRYLGHLPLGCTFHFVEISMEPPLISNETFSKMSEALTFRQLRRQDRDHIDRMLTLAKEEAENCLQSLPIGSRMVGHMALENDGVPTDDDFVPLSVATGTATLISTASVTPPPHRSFACVSKLGACGVVDDHRVANFPKQAPEKSSSHPALSSWFDVTTSGGLRRAKNQSQQETSAPDTWPRLGAGLSSSTVPEGLPAFATTGNATSPTAAPLPTSTRKNKRRRNANKNTPPIEELVNTLSLVRRSPNL